MANVLNKTTKAYLQSVNTPDYPETDWIINPDMSLVVGVPPHYWAIDSIQVEIGTDPETELPVYETMYAVREMTPSEKTEYDSAHPTTTISNRLDDGTPAYQYQGRTISINGANLTFTVKTSGAKKFVVPFVTTGGAYTCDRNRLITNISVMATCGTDFDLIAKIDGQEAGRWTLTKTSRRVPNLVLDLVAGSTLAFSIESTANVSDPVVIVDTSYTN